MGILINWLLLSVAVFVVARILPGIHIRNFMTAIIVALIYSVISFFTSWLLVLLTLPLVLITFGLFKLVINAFLLWITDKMVADFEIKDFFTTFIAALLITLVDTGLKIILW